MFMKKVITILLGLLVFLSLTAFTVFVSNLSPEQNLGQMLYFDQNLSLNRNQSCSSCHDPGSGFADPQSSLPVSQGSDPTLFGGRNAPSSAYAAFSPFFYWDSNDAIYVGGQFWDGRANTLAEQAAGPFFESCGDGYA